MTFKDYAYYGYSGISIKQKYIVTVKGRYIVALVGIKDQLLRLRYPKSYSSVQYLPNATNDLKCLVALMIARLVPVGIVADKIQEEFPEHEKVCEILRNWERIRSKLEA